MDVCMTLVTGYERLASQSDHTLHPSWFLLTTSPAFFQVGELADMVYLAIFVRATQFTFFRLEALDKVSSGAEGNISSPNVVVNRLSTG